MTPPFRIGVRGKLLGLLGGTALVSLLLACVVFVVYDRRSFSEAKQRTLAVLTGSVAQSAFGPTAFGDPDSAKVILNVLEGEASAQSGAIFSKDGSLLVEWRRQGSRYPVPIPSVAVDGFASGKLIISRPIENAEGRTGTLVVVFSTDDIAQRTQRFVLLAGGVLLVSVLFALGLATVSHRLITRPVTLLSAAARQVREHKDFGARAARVTDDELGDLTDMFNNMLTTIQTRDRELESYRHNLEELVRSRTADLERRNGEMRVVMDNVGQGMVTIGVTGELAAERSAVFDRWFDSPAPGTGFGAMVEHHDPQFGPWFELCLDQLRDGLMPPELTLMQMPRRFVANHRTYDVAYTPILADGKIERLLVIVTDMTDAIQREATEREQREMIELFQRINIDRGGVQAFLSEAATLLEGIRRERDPVVERRLVHTLKGNCAIYGLDSYAMLAHDVESELAETGGALTAPQRERLVRVWKETMTRVGALLGGQQAETVAVGRGEILDLIRRASDPGVIAGTLRNWLLEPARLQLERLARQANGLAPRLGKPALDIEVDDGGVRLEADAWRSFWAAAVHVVRNAVDHGVETAEERQSVGKPAAGKLTFTARREGSQIELTFSDDGRGIDWEKLRERAIRGGLPHHTQQDLINAMHMDGVSTRSTATEISGRGIGLGALRAEINRRGGRITVESTPGVGTTFRYTFDEQQIHGIKSERRYSQSLLPFLS